MSKTDPTDRRGAGRRSILRRAAALTMAGLAACANGGGAGPATKPATSPPAARPVALAPLDPCQALAVVLLQSSPRATVTLFSTMGVEDATAAALDGWILRLTAEAPFVYRHIELDDEVSRHFARRLGVVPYDPTVDVSIAGMKALANAPTPPEPAPPALPTLGVAVEQGLEVGAMHLAGVDVPRARNTVVNQLVEVFVRTHPDRADELEGPAAQACRTWALGPGATTAAVELPRTRGADHPPSDVALVAPAALETLTRLAIGEGDAPTILERIGGRWRVRSAAKDQNVPAAGHPANADNVKKALTNLTEMRVQQGAVIEETGGRSHGHLPAGARRRIAGFAGDAKVFDFVLGPSGPRGTAITLTEGGSAQLGFEVSGYLFDAAAPRWLDLDLLTFERSDVREIRIENLHGPATLREKAGRWTTTWRGQVRDAKSEQVLDMVNAFRHLRASGIAPEADPATLTSAATVTFVLGASTHVVHLGKAGSGMWTARVDENPTVYVVEAWVGQWSQQDPSRFGRPVPR